MVYTDDVLSRCVQVTSILTAACAAAAAVRLTQQLSMLAGVDA
jgi:hypothetical protein